MKYVLLAIFGAIGGVYIAYRTGSAVIDNALIDTGLSDNESDVSSSDEVIAVKNNNPLNIRASSDNWVGTASPRSIDGFVNFTKPEYGYRAAARIILNSYAAQGATTLSQVINKWAPPSENSTNSYINFVVNKSGIAANAKITQDNIDDLFYAMTIIESGKAQPMSVIKAGLSL